MTRSAGDTPGEATTEPRAAEAKARERTFVPQFALDAADAKIATWSTALVDTADTIDRLISAESLPVPDGVRELASTTTQKLRGFGEQSGEYEASELVASLQRTASAHPAASIGVGAAVGAALAALVVRLGSQANKDEKTPARDQSASEKA